MALNQPQCAPYGTWQSPIRAELLASDTVSIQQTEVDVNNVNWMILAIMADHKMIGNLRKYILSGRATY
jgi:hypothetical protein